MILKKLEVGPFASNCYIVGDEITKEGMVIDPGAEGDLIIQTIKSLGLTIKYIVLTHSHIDHTGAINEVKKETGATLAIHKKDVDGLQRSPFRMMMPSAPLPPPPDLVLKAGDTIRMGKFVFKILHTPGHTPGGICLSVDDIVFTGDTLFNLSIGRTDFPGGNYEEELESIRTQLMILPNKTTVYPGHGSDSTIGAERVSNPFLSWHG